MPPIVCRTSEEAGLNAGRPGWAVEELEAILDALPARVAWWDRDLNLLFANAAMLAAVGLTRSQMRGQNMAEFVGPDALARDAEHFRLALQGLPQEYDRSGTAADGSPEYRMVHVVPNVVDGEVTGLFVLGVDGAARVEAERAARENDARAAVLRERQVIAADLDGEVMAHLGAATQALTQAAALADRAASAALRASVADRIDAVIRSLRRAIRTLRDPRRTADVLRPAEQLATATTRGLRTTNAPETCDLGPSELTSDELLSILDHLPAIITAFDADFYNTFANEAALDWYRWGSRQVLRGQHGSKLLGDAAYQASLPFGQAAMAGRPQQFVRAMSGTGRLTRHTQIDYTAQVVDGVAIGAVALVYDVTARVEAEDAMRASVERVALLHERERIAEDLHDLVIQRLFAAELQFAGPSGAEPHRMKAAMETIDDAIEELRIAVHELHGGASDIDLVAGVERVVRQAAGTLGFDPAVHWEQSTGPVPAAIAADVLAVLTEALSNAARHGKPTRVDVVLVADSGAVRLRVTDDGRGIGATTRVSGLANMAARAERRGGSCAWRPRQPNGTVVEWFAPLPTSSRGGTRTAGAAKGSRTDVNP